MGDSLKSIDLSNYLNSVSKINQNVDVTTTINDSNTTNNKVENIDFSNIVSNSKNDMSISDNYLSADIYLVNDTNSSFQYEEIDDFSENEYSDYTINKYMTQYGDVNGDGKVTDDDVSLIQKYLSSDERYNNVFTPILNSSDFTLNFRNQIINTRIKSGVGDIDGDGKVTLKDATIMQNYISNGELISTNITMANRLDTIKYTDVQTKNNDDLSQKKGELDFIKDLMGYQNVVNNITVVPDSSFDKINGKSKSEPFGINAGSEEDYLFYNTIRDHNLSLAFPGGHDQMSKEELKQSLTKRLINSTLYRKNHNTMLVNPNKGVEDAACDYVLKHASEIVDYEMEYGSLQEAKASYQSNIAALTYSKKQINKQIELIPYNNTMKTADFK